MQRAEVLSAAGEAVRDRGLNYGNPEDNFARIARLWNAHLHNITAYPVPELRPGDVAIMMGMVKDARLANDMSHADSWIDKAGYAACGGEVSPAEDNVIPFQTAKTQAAPEVWVAGSAFRLGVDQLFSAREIGEDAPAPDYKPQEQFGFRVGETVNLTECEKYERPGIVAGFAGSEVRVRWPRLPGFSFSESIGAHRPADLRHGP